MDKITCKQWQAGGCKEPSDAATHRGSTAVIFRYFWLKKEVAKKIIEEQQMCKIFNQKSS